MFKQRLSEKDIIRLKEYKVLFKDAKFEPINDFEKYTKKYIARILTIVTEFDIIKVKKIFKFRLTLVN